MSGQPDHDLSARVSRGHPFQGRSRPVERVFGGYFYSEPATIHHVRELDQSRRPGTRDKPLETDSSRPVIRPTPDHADRAATVNDGPKCPGQGFATGNIEERVDAPTAGCPDLRWPGRVAVVERLGGTERPNKVEVVTAGHAQHPRSVVPGDLDCKCPYARRPG